jgi:hypothetical protein
MVNQTENAIWNEIKDCLLAAKNVNKQALKSYPQPIAGCDVQFQHIYDERDRIAKELTLLNDLSKAPKPMVSFLQTSNYIDPATVGRLTTALTTTH